MQPYYDDGQIQIFHADCREVLPTQSRLRQKRRAQVQAKGDE